MTKSQHSWVRSQHPLTQWNLRGGRWSSVEYSKLKKKIQKPPVYKKNICQDGSICVRTIVHRCNIWPEARQEWNQRPNPKKSKKSMVYGTLYRSWQQPHLMSTPTHYIMGNPMPESTLTLCQSRLYPAVRDFGFGLRVKELESIAKVLEPRTSLVCILYKQLSIVQCACAYKQYSPLKQLLLPETVFTFYVYMHLCTVSCSSLVLVCTMQLCGYLQ